MALANVRFGSKADISACLYDVRFTPESGHRLRQLSMVMLTAGAIVGSKGNPIRARHHAPTMSRARATGCPPVDRAGDRLSA